MLTPAELDVIAARANGIARHRFESTIVHDLAQLDVPALIAALREAWEREARVRALCDESRVAISAGCWCDGEDDHEHTSRPLGWTLDPEQVRAALDGEA